MANSDDNAGLTLVSLFDLPLPPDHGDGTGLGPCIGDDG
jgi:hypothetical protein